MIRNNPRALQKILISRFSWQAWAAVSESQEQATSYKLVSRGNEPETTTSQKQRRSRNELTDAGATSNFRKVKTLELVQGLDGRLKLRQISDEHSIIFEEGLISRTVKPVTLISSPKIETNSVPTEIRGSLLETSQSISDVDKDLPSGSTSSATGTTAKTNSLHPSLTPSRDEAVVNASDDKISGHESNNNSSRKPDEKRRPDFGDLDNVMKAIEVELPRLLKWGTKFKDFHREDVELIDNIRGKTVTGLQKYELELEMLKLWSAVRNSYCNVSVLNMNGVIEDGTVRVRWRINYIGGFEIFYKFWKFPLTGGREALNKKARWYDGYSILYVDAKGLVYKHIVDKVMPDDEETVKEREKVNLEELARKAAGSTVPAP